MNKILFVFFITAFMCSSAQASEKQTLKEISPFTPTQIKKAIDAYGPADVLKYIMDDLGVVDGRTDKLVKGIKSGKAEWLDLFIQFWNVSDAGWTNVLTNSLSYALANSPHKSLMIINEIEGYGKYNKPSFTEMVCGDLDENWTEGDQDYIQLSQTALAEINKRIKKIKFITDPHLENVKKQCLDELYRRKEYWHKKTK